MEITAPFQSTATLYYAFAAVLTPLLAFILNCCLPGSANKLSGVISTAAILISAILSGFTFAHTWNHQPIHISATWFTIGDTKIYAGILLNNLSVLMLLLVSLIALPVHIYSTAYMKYDANFKRYFTYLSFFCFSMLALVVAGNLFLLYGFWELMGFSSYLLIGFWFTKDKAVQANKKAFIINRIGDVGLLVAIIIIFAQYHTADISLLFGEDALVNSASQIPAAWQFVAFAGIFLAVAAKSAQFPLHTWLPDAMAGPTAVSALIHAATMVAAGVFLLGRVYPIFNTNELTFLAFIGCFTAFMAATIALTQNDLKRILAYSTISQLGFMVMAMGVGAYASSLFHLVTHAFFKCLLFLAAGIVIHQMQHIKEENDLDIDPQNILYMGGLRKRLPFTFITAVIASLALIGIPLTSGYLSKDGILIQAFEWSDGKSWLFRLVPIGAILSSLLTAFYIGRLMVKIFYGEFKLLKFNPHIKNFGDGNWQYKLPLIFLATCCLFPLFSLNPVLYEQAWLLNGFPLMNQLERVDIYHTIIPVGANILNVFVIYAAYFIYVKRNTFTFNQKGILFRLSYHEWYIDKIYSFIIVKPILALCKSSSWFDKNIIDGFINLLKYAVLFLSKLTAWADKNIIDGLLHLLAAIVQQIGNFARSFQSGKIQYYLFSMLAIILALFVLKTVL